MPNPMSMTNGTALVNTLNGGLDMGMDMGMIMGMNTTNGLVDSMPANIN